MANCYLCNDSLSEQNHSLEHIIQESIGGRLKSKALICKPCNDKTGSLFDREFAKFGNILASKYNINRERGIVQPIKAKNLSTGEKLIVAPGYKLASADPKIEVTNDLIKVSHHDKKRVFEEMKKLAKDLDGIEITRKDLQFEITEDDNTEKKFLIDIAIEPNLLLRSVSKTIVNLYIHKTEDYQNCSPLINFLKEDIDNNFCWFLDYGVSKSKHNNSPYHIVIIRGDKKSKLLYAYYEIFGEVGFLTLINGKYRGENQEINYTFDPINITEVKSNYEFNLKATDIIEHLITKPESEMVKCLHH